MGKISIKPEREYLREVTSKLKQGTYAIPAFQRDFVWKPNQVVDLFDSISKGYPIGSIILWKPTKDEVPMAKNIVNEVIRENTDAEYFILDGRQRTTAFFGCIYDWPDKSELFRLFYDPEQETFVYKTKRNFKSRLFAVSDVFDTFKMLGLLQSIQQEILDKELARKYIERIKELNTVLQQYEIGEVLIDNCTLEESGTVFSRINSKGTDISKVAMLQAKTYKDKNSVLLADSINKIIENLSVYGFGDMKPDDVLNCFYRYIGRNFYDNKVAETLVKADLESIIPNLIKDVTCAIEFLYKRCGVINYRLLPYNRQLIAIASFFKEKSQPTEKDLKEMEKWFFYTTYEQTFLNGSLGNVRMVFRRFDDYLKGKVDTPIEYHKIYIDSRLDFKYSSSSAQSNFISLCQILRRRIEDPHTKLEYCGEFRYHGHKPANSFLLLTPFDRDKIKEYLEGMPWSDNASIYLLDDEMLTQLTSGHTSMYLHLRKRKIIELSKNKLKELGLICFEDNLSETGNIEDNIEGIISEFSDLNNDERRELCELLENNNHRNSVVYQIEDNGDGSFTIGYNSFNRSYKLNNVAAGKLIRLISDKFCNGEDPADYYSWSLSLENKE